MRSVAQISLEFSTSVVFRGSSQATTGELKTEFELESEGTQR